MHNAHAARRDRAVFGSNLSIFSKGLLLISIPILLQLLLLAVLRNVEAGALAAESLAAHSKDVLSKADNLALLITQSMASMRAAVIAGDASYDLDAGPAPGVIPGRVAELSALVRDNPSQSERMARLRNLVGRLETYVAAERLLLRDGKLAEARSRSLEGEGRQRMVDFDRELAAFLAEENRLDQLRLEQLHTANQRSLQLTTAAALLSLPIAGILVYVFMKGISGRLSIVAANAARLTADAPLASAQVAGTDEIAQLDRTLHETSQRLAEAFHEKQRARIEIERRVTELARVNHELAQQTQENEMFIYSVSHDLRSPLVNLQGFSKELARSCEDLRRALEHAPLPDPTRARTTEIAERDIPEAIYFIQTAVSRAAAIIDALLRLSRVGRIDYRHQPVSVDTVITHVLDAMHGTIVERHAEIVRQPVADAWGDPTAIEQIFGNLIGNAVNYLNQQRRGRIEIGMLDDNDGDDRPPRGDTGGDTGGSLGERAGEGGSRGVGSPDPDAGSWHTYYVRDNGLGIPASALPRIFVAFQRLHTQAAAGEGIGLPLVRRIVDRHRGRIWVESTEGAGTTVFVTLPGDAAAAEQAPPDTHDLSQEVTERGRGDSQPDHRGR